MIRNRRAGWRHKRTAPPPISKTARLTRAEWTSQEYTDSVQGIFVLLVRVVTMLTLLAAGASAMIFANCLSSSGPGSLVLSMLTTTWSIAPSKTWWRNRDVARWRL